MNPLISVIISTYNQSEYIEEALLSLIGQTYTDWECIVINDGSTDATESIVKEIMTTTDKIQYLCQENAGVIVARNKAFEYATGSHILFFDSDDVMKQDHLQSLLEPFNEFETDIVFCDTQRFITKENYYEFASGRNCPAPEGLIATEKMYRLLFDYNFITIHSALMKREVFVKVGGFSINTAYLEDYAFWFSAAAEKFRFYHINKAIALYRVAQKDTKLPHRKIIGKKLTELEFLNRNFDKEIVSKNELQEKIKSVHRNCIRELIANGHVKECNDEIKSFLKIYPTSPSELIRALEFKLKLFLLRFK